MVNGKKSPKLAEKSNAINAKPGFLFTPGPLIIDIFFVANDELG